jgi:hypothetical protein
MASVSHYSKQMREAKKGKRRKVRNEKAIKRQRKGDTIPLLTP